MSRADRRRSALAAAVLAAGMVATGACARMGRPPGGPEDRIPPQVVATTPDTFAVLEGPYREAVVFRFNERISERPAQGELSDAVVVSPRTGQVEVEHSRESLEVSIIGGFREGVVYRISLQPVLRDMFQNQMLEPFELVFSTGPDIEPYVLAGTVSDRITGEALAGARVNAVLESPGADTLVHTAVTDTGGVFAMRYVPPGRYQLTAFEDRNRNGRLNEFEPRGRHPGILDPPADTSIAEIEVLTPDSSAARVVSVEVADSAALMVETDDYLDPGSRYLDSVRVEVSRGQEAEAGAEAPGVDSLFHTLEWERRLAAIDSLAGARADSLTTVADSLAAAGDSAVADSVRALARRAAPPSGGGGQRSGGAPGEDEAARAEQTFYALLDGPLEVNVPYRVAVEGITNINGVPGGGGDASVSRAPPPDTARADTASTSGADTTAVPDTAAAEPDTAGAQPDTTSGSPEPDAEAAGAAPGTTAVPDTAGGAMGWRGAARRGPRPRPARQGREEPDARMRPTEVPVG